MLSKKSGLTVAVMPVFFRLMGFGKSLAISLEDRLLKPEENFLQNPLKSVRKEWVV